MERKATDRVGVIVTTREYYRLFWEAAQEARESILIAGWDFQPDLRLVREEEADGAETELGALLEELARDNPGLDIRIISWNYSLLIAGVNALAEQAEWTVGLPDNLHFEFDPQELMSGAHHHKIAVIDDCLAFVGGVDLSIRRWDTERRHPEDPHRIDPTGEEYGPWHDVQLVVDGEAARYLAYVVREQWENEAGERPPSASPREAPWPDIDPHFEHVAVDFARTWPTDDGGDEQPLSRDVEVLYYRLIRNASTYVYIENQYLSHEGLVAEICERLREPEGPEFVLIVPAEFRELHEEASFGVDRDQKAAKLREADVHGRLRIMTPWTGDGSEERDVYVHSKTMIVDDEHLLVGSANLADRSMTIDTEVVAVVTTDGGASSEKIREVRDHLLGLHLGMGREVVGYELELRGSMCALVDSIENDQGPTLLPLVTDDEDDQPVIPMWFADPQSPLWQQPEMWVATLIFVGITVGSLVYLL